MARHSSEHFVMDFVWVLIALILLIFAILNVGNSLSRRNPDGPAKLWGMFKNFISRRYFLLLKILMFKSFSNNFECFFFFLPPLNSWSVRNFLKNKIDRRSCISYLKVGIKVYTRILHVCLVTFFSSS